MNHVQRGDISALHNSEGGIPDLWYDATAFACAKHLARYISCPSTIRSYVANNYGVRIPVDEIKGLQQDHKTKRDSYAKAAEAIEVKGGDAADFRVRGLLQRPRLRADQFAPMPEPETKTRVTRPVIVSELIDAIADEFGLTSADLVGPSRKRAIVDARKTLSFVLVERGNSLSWIGGKLNRDHSTIVHLVQCFKASASDKMKEIAGRYLERGA